MNLMQISVHINYIMSLLFTRYFVSNTYITDTERLRTQIDFIKMLTFCAAIAAVAQQYDTIAD